MNTKILLTVFTSLIGTAVFAADVPPVGSAAPDFSLTDTKGSTHSLSEYKGKYVVLEWFNPECPFVKKHYGSSNMQNLQKEYTDKGVVWLTIDSNAPGTQGNLTAEEAAKIATSWKTHETALLLDPEGKAGQAYGAKNTPNMVIINPDGKIIYHGAIDNKATPNPADIPTSTNYVKAALDESLGGKICHNLANEALRLLGQIQVVIKFLLCGIRKFSERRSEYGRRFCFARHRAVHFEPSAAEGRNSLLCP